MNKEINTNAFNIAIFDKNSREWIPELDIDKLNPMFKKSAKKTSNIMENRYKAAYGIELATRILKTRIKQNGVLSLAEVLDRLDIPVKDNQRLAGWDADNYDPTELICEVSADKENQRVILNFVNCDETMLLKRYKKIK